MIRVLAILPRLEDRLALADVFRRSKWHLDATETLHGSRTILAEGLHGVVVCDSRLPDGDWKNLLDEFASKHVITPLIVAARHADDRLWAEVLNLGGYDILQTPFQRKEVVRSVSLAWRRGQARRLSVVAG